MNTITTIQRAMLTVGKNVPLLRKEVKSLPKGFHPTAVFETKRQKLNRKHREKVLNGTAKRKQKIWTFNKETSKWTSKIVYHF